MLKADCGMVTVGYLNEYFSPSGKCRGSPLSMAVTFSHDMFTWAGSSGGKKGVCAIVMVNVVSWSISGPSLLPGESGVYTETM